MNISTSNSPQVIEAYRRVQEAKRLQQLSPMGAAAPEGITIGEPPPPEPETNSFRLRFLPLLAGIFLVALIAAVIRMWLLEGGASIGFWEFMTTKLFAMRPVPANDFGPGADTLGPLIAIAIAVERLIETGFDWYERSTRSAASVLRQFQTTGDWVGAELNNAIEAVAIAAAKLGAETEPAQLAQFNVAKQRLSDAEELVHGWTKGPEYVAFKRAISIIIGIVGGLVVSITGGLGFLAAMGVQVPHIIDVIVTGFVLGAGPGPMHQIIGLLQGAKDSLGGLATTLQNTGVKSEVEKLRAEVALVGMGGALPSGSNFAWTPPTQPPTPPTGLPPVLPPVSPASPGAQPVSPPAPSISPTSPPGPGDDGAWG